MLARAAVLPTSMCWVLAAWQFAEHFAGASAPQASPSSSLVTSTLLCPPQERVHFPPPRTHVNPLMTSFTARSRECTRIGRCANWAAKSMCTITFIERYYSKIEIKERRQARTNLRPLQETIARALISTYPGTGATEIAERFLNERTG
jgi:hypothetical protein